MRYTRRHTLAALTGGLSLLPWRSLPAMAEIQPVIATNTYPWSTFAKRNGQQLELHTDELLGDIASAGLGGYEPIINRPTELSGLGDRLKKHGLTINSIYVNSVLHDKALAQNSVDGVLAIAKEANKLGTRIIVTNPAPLKWGGSEDKSDRQLRLQAGLLNELGAELQKMGMTLAYHNHDAELRRGGREFHHMLTATEPANVRFCLDAHWIFRGCGNSEVAVFDALAHYHHRIVELHLRQSVSGIWTEAFSMTGDINYERLFDYLFDRDVKPHFVLEQAVESGTPSHLDVVAAHRIGQQNVRQALN